jgi:tight adherence protein B
MALVTFALLLVALFTLSRVLFPRRNVLEEYSDILDNRRNLGPKSAAEEQPRPGERFVTRLLSRRGYLEPIQERIEEAGWPLRTSEFVMLHLGSVALVIVVVLAFSAPLVVSLPIVVMAAITPLLLLDHKAKQRRQEFETQVPDTLVLMANSLRAGQGFEQALRVVADEGSDPTAQEFQRLLAQQRLGVPPEDTLRSLADRMKSEAFDWAVMATIIQRQVGGNLAEIYEKIAETIRGREVLRREIRTLTAEGRFSAFILVVLPFGIGGVIASIRPEYASLLWTTKAGLTMLGCALVAMVIGILWIRRIIRFDT